MLLDDISTGTHFYCKIPIEFIIIGIIVITTIIIITSIQRKKLYKNKTNLLKK